MRNKEYNKNRYLRLGFHSILLTAYFLLSSCGYYIIGSKSLPFDSITIKPIQNKTYEPRLEESLHNALSKEFITQGVKVMAAGRPDTSGSVPGGDIDLEATITTFELSPIAAVDERVKEQAITMRVDIKIIYEEKITEFKAIESPIKITFESTGTVSESVIQKERAINKACRGIAKEIVSRIIMRYVK